MNYQLCIIINTPDFDGLIELTGFCLLVTFFGKKN
jgi:hypothetical protein